ncbi:MAG TPA: MBG domain-containing protein, partial [Flavisolibacter sp.]
MQALRNPLLLLLCAILMMAKAATAQNVTKIEYFFDTDPGFGKGTAISVTPGTDVTAAFDIDINPLSFGFHKLYIRGYVPPYQVTENGKTVTQGGWSHTQIKSIYKQQLAPTNPEGLSPIVAGEYFIGADPGFGNGVAVPVTQGVNLSNVAFAFDITALAKGFHQLSVRFKDANGTWSTTHTRSFYKESYTTPGSDPAAPITYGEYFIDTDPGFGKGTPVSLTSGMDHTVTFTADITSLSKGFHYIQVRFKDARGVWSNTHGRSFYKEVLSSANTPLSKIAKLEYFVDTDPGFGKGTTIALPPSLDIDNYEFLMDMTNISIGNHKVYVRAQDESGVWSMIKAGDFEIKAPTELIISLGNINTTICAGATFDIPFTVNAPFGSNNVFTAQLSNANGVFAASPINIGSITGSGDSTIQAVIPSGTAAGTNYRIRIIASSPLDTSGNSSPIIIKRVPEAHLTIAGNAPTCLGTATYNATPLDANATTYTWALADGGTFDTIRGTSVNVTWNKAGTFVLKMTASNTCGNGAERTYSVKVFANATGLVPVITASGRNLTVSNTPPADSANGYRWYRDGVLVPSLTAYSVSPTQDGHYTVRFANPCGEGPESNGLDYFVNKQVQTVTFAAIDDTTFGQIQYVVLSATASSGLPVTFSITQGNGISHLKSDTLYITGAGNITVKASQDGNNTYAPASANVSFVVRKAPATITFSNLTQVYNGAAKQPTITTIPGNLNVTTTFNELSTKPTNAGSYKVVATISSNNYQGIDSTTFVIEKATQSISLATIPDLQLASGSYKTGVKASSNQPVTLSLTTEPVGIATTSNDSIYLTGLGKAFLVATQDGNNNYHAATPVKDTFEIRKTTQTINFPVIADKIWGTAPFALSAVASSGLPVSYRLVSGPATLNNNTITLTGLGRVIIETTQPGNDVYNAATPVQRSFAVVAYPDLFVQNVMASKTDVSPGETVMVSWKVSNIGTGQAKVKWTERISVQAAGGANKTTIHLGNFTEATPLDTAASMNRSAVVTLPTALNIGDEGYFVVELIADTSVHEQAVNLANNTAVQQTALNFKKILTLDLSANQITEGAATGITATVKRSGSIANALTVNISAKYPQRLTVPASVTIPAGQAGASFTITAPNNSAIEGTLLDSIQVAASSFTGAGTSLSIIDNDQAALTITNLPAEVTEGATVTFNVNTNLTSAIPQTVYLTSNKAAKFPVPSSVVIPAGSATVTVTVAVPQNTTPEADQAVEIKAGATAQTAVTGNITVKDDDLPNLQLVLQTSAVSEGAGIYATKATLRRTATSNTVAFTANLSASLPNTLILPNSITLNAAENEKTFDVGVVDNTLNEGQRQVAITASVYIASCGCSAAPTSSGSVSANLTINDNDGPTLTLTATPLTLAEGAATAGTLRITRNTSTTAALSVNLATSDSSEATLPATATIPAGSAYVEVPIATYNDGVADGSQTVYFNATATGFSTGTVWAMVTDQNKPDLTIPAVSLSSNSVQAQTLFNYNVTVKNNGLS